MCSQCVRVITRLVLVRLKWERVICCTTHSHKHNTNTTRTHPEYIWKCEWDDSITFFPWQSSYFFSSQTFICVGFFYTFCLCSAIPYVRARVCVCVINFYFVYYDFCIMQGFFWIGGTVLFGWEKKVSHSGFRSTICFFFPAWRVQTNKRTDSVLCVSVLLCSYLYYISWNFAFNFEWFFLHGFELVSVVDGVLWEYVFIWWRVVVVAAAKEEATYWSVTVWFFLNISHCARYIRSILVFENMVNSVQ